MWKSLVLLLCLSGYCLAGPVGTKRNMPIVQQNDESTAAATSMESLAESEPAAVVEPELMIMSTLTLPSNATSIRADITDGFSCVNKTYGYYADVDNDCQIFHVCLPVTYADGKENTFRWSFICPEETIFSQDSFTCMRPDDMTITCDESYQYYELNRNFGMVESESEKENTEETAATENEKPNETIMEAEETQSESVKPIMPEEEQEKIVPKPVQQAVKVQKPNRRKPAVSYATQKKPTNSHPLRKMPQAKPVMPETVTSQVSEDNTEAIKPVQEEEEEIKPVVQKFSRRPVKPITNTIKDKIQTSKPESTNNIRTQLYNQNRKRPSMFNKKPVEQLEEVKPEQPPIEIETPAEQQIFSSLESDMSNTNTETQSADSEIQASETQQVFVKPEEPKEDEVKQTEEEPIKVEEIPVESEKIEEPVQILEAFEEIPAVIVEKIETQSAAEEVTPEKEEQMPVMATEEEIIGESETNAEESLKSEETQAVVESQTAEETIEETKSVEEVQSAEDSQTNEEPMKIQIIEKIEQPQAAEEILSVEELKPVEESVEELKPVEEPKPIEEILAMEEPQPVEVVKPSEDNQTLEESQMVEDTQTIEEAKPIDVNEQPEQFPASEETEVMKTDVVAEPAIFENSEEGLASAPVQTIEEMEDERPAEAPESMPATDEMNHPDPMVQQMLEDLEDNKPSIGGFKPVDPVMAHEAEQLIADFINTLRKNDFTNETPGYMMQEQQNANSEQEQTQEQDNVSAVEEQPSEDLVKSEETDKVEEANKTEEVEEVVKSNEVQEVKDEAQPEVAEPQTLSQENNAAEEIQDYSSESKPETMSENNNESLALKSLETQSSENVEESAKPQEQQADTSQMIMINNMPQEMYQIPVQVITTPLEQMSAESENKPIELTASTEDKLEETPVKMETYKPLSIDDIVELVKERLDHMPKDEMETPMQLEQVLGDMQEDKATEEKQPLEEAAQSTQQSEEEIVMPIYTRTVQPVKIDAGVQTENQEQILTQEQSEAAEGSTDVKEKSNRSYRSRSMLTPKLDPRKRAFLFKSDKFKSS